MRQPHIVERGRKVAILLEQGVTYEKIGELLELTYDQICYCRQDPTKDRERTSRRRERAAANPRPLRSRYGRIQNLCNGPAPFTYAELETVAMATPTCYLTGRPVDYQQGHTYELDHVVPLALGGTNELSNLRLANADANRSKRDLALADFVQLCREVAAHWEGRDPANEPLSRAAG